MTMYKYGKLFCVHMCFTTVIRALAEEIGRGKVLNSVRLKSFNPWNAKEYKKT